MLEIMNMKPPTGDTPPGQVLFDDQAIRSWKVPPGIFFISAVGIGNGGSRTSQSSPAQTFGGTGGGNSWRASIPVTPGETLTINTWTEASIKRGNEILLIAQNGGRTAGSSGIGGKAANAINDGGANGAQGSTYGGSTSGPVSGGGAGGYNGPGGAGNGSPPPAINGSGMGGLHNGAGLATMGGGCGAKGAGPSGTTNGQAGSNGVGPLYGGGSSGNASTGNRGCVRIIWGEGRAYPSTNTGDV